MRNKDDLAASILINNHINTTIPSYKESISILRHGEPLKQHTYLKATEKLKRVVKQKGANKKAEKKNVEHSTQPMNKRKEKKNGSKIKKKIEAHKLMSERNLL